ncbi:nucleotide exchange factor GrpE [Xanthobacter agilis]|uniref:Protein GrpE n=1 Tax=Xanthobacter agilis TaxID=47492 RepID=A0ABU0LGK1_XANAG|nr:nucleotide exchange factor GrpE [Xanthobacter agilis]MDQ0506277.1 molecular chaperone GrpE [Xanthobacter agilis]
MSEQTRAPETGDGFEDTGANGAAETEAGAQPSLQAEKERLEAEIAALKDKYLRAFAEAENVRRRADKEVADAKVYGIASFARDMLTVADDLSRALSAVDDETKAQAEGPVKALLEGIEITERGLGQALEKHKIRRIEPRGEKFDPNLHQAMFEVPDPSVPSGTVVQVVQAGYVIGERVLRPALVGVARGGPKAEAGEARPQTEA